MVERTMRWMMLGIGVALAVYLSAKCILILSMRRYHFVITYELTMHLLCEERRSLLAVSWTKR